MIIEIPPPRLQRQEFRARAQPHICDTEHRKRKVVAQPSMVNSFCRELRKFCVEIRTHLQSLVVFAEKLFRLKALNG